MHVGKNYHYFQKIYPSFIIKFEFRFFVQNYQFRQFVRFSSKTNSLCPFICFIIIAIDSIIEYMFKIKFSGLRVNCVLYMISLKATCSKDCPIYVLKVLFQIHWCIRVKVYRLLIIYVHRKYQHLHCAVCWLDSPKSFLTCRIRFYFNCSWH